MQFVAGANTITIDNPMFGYSVEVVMAINVVESITGWKFFDLGVANDYRILSGIKHCLTAAQMADLIEFFANTAKGRGENVTLRLGATSTGFFPGGADLGDVGDFSVRLETQSPTGMQVAPWKRFNDDLILRVLTSPGTGLPSQVDQGDFQIGTIDKLEYPQDGFKPSCDRAFSQTFTSDGTPAQVDLGTGADRWTTEWTQTANTSKMAALIDELSDTIRYSDNTIVAPANYYPFGIEKGSSGAGTFTVNLLTNSLKMTHLAFNEWSLPLKYWFKSVIAGEE